jgi:hypothetical protein
MDTTRIEHAPHTYIYIYHTLFNKNISIYLQKYFKKLRLGADHDPAEPMNSY